MTRRVGPRQQPDGASSCVRWGHQPCYVVFAKQKVTVEHPRYARPRAEKPNSITTRGCNTMGGDSGRCEKASSGADILAVSPGCP